MIQTSTLFILGAGASASYGYPTGPDLRYQICERFPAQLAEILRNQNEMPSAARQILNTTASGFAEVFFKSSTASIDLFLSRNKTYMDIGKIAICLRILEAEQKSKFNEKIDDTQLDWYKFIYHKMTETIIDSRQIDEFSKNRVSFITFNYDRSLEYYLATSFLNSFSDYENKAHLVDLLESIPIRHVYGRIAQPPWQKGLDYRQKVNYQLASDLAKNIKIVHERNRPDKDYVASLISEAERIFILGFGYAAENLDAIRVPELLQVRHKIFGSALNFTAKEIGDIEARLYNPKMAFPKNSISIEDTDALSLLRKYL